MSKRSLPLKAATFGAAASLLTLTVGSPALRAVTYGEVGDAGQLPGNAQRTNAGAAPGQPLTDIFGSVASSTDADLYFINITDPATFSVTTVNAGTNAPLDTQVFLFTLAGAPIYTNDDTPDGTSIQSTLPAGNSLLPLVAGTYLLGISLGGNDPVNVNGQPLFAPLDENNLSTDVRGPNSDLQPAQLGSFVSSGFTGTGLYDLQLTGAATAVPEPSTLVLGALGAVGLAAVRRRPTV